MAAPVHLCKEQEDTMKIKGAIFDMDGTLVDSMFMWYELGYLFLK